MNTSEERVTGAMSLFKALKEQNDFEDALENIGVRYEYGEGVLGKFMLENKNALIDTLYFALGLHRKEFKTQVHVMGYVFDSIVSVLFPDDGCLDYAITEDNFTELLYSGMEDAELAKDIVSVCLKRDVEAKKKINNKWRDEKYQMVGVEKFMKEMGLTPEDGE